MTKADYDLEQFIDFIDEAFLSKDERVVNALRSLMMMVILTKPQASDEGLNGDVGPLRQMQKDLQRSEQRIDYLERDIKNITTALNNLNTDSMKYRGVGGFRAYDTPSWLTDAEREYNYRWNNR